MSKSKDTDKKDEPQPGSHGLELGIMNKGDYMIHIFIESGKNFVLGDEDGSKSTIDAIIKLDCSGKQQYSKTLKDVVLKSDSTRYWGQHFFFEPKNMSSDDISSQVLTIKVMDKGFLRDSLVGFFDIDVSQVYFQNNEHALFNQWVALSNPECQDKSEIKGYLQLSIAVQGPSDNAVKLSEAIGLQDLEKINVLMPASIRKDYKQLSISIIEAQNLPKMDTFGTIDAYIKTVFNKHTYKTQVVNPKKEGQDLICPFNKVFQIPLQWPISNDRLTMSVWDYEKTIPDELAGTFEFSLKELVKNCSSVEGQFRWANIYGAPIATGFQGPMQEKMNNHPEIASHWKGRLLVHIKVSDSKTPVKGTFDIEDKVLSLKGLKEKKTMQKYQFQFEIGSGICLPGKEKYRVRLQMGKFIIDSNQPIDYNNEYCRWNQRIENKGFETPCQSLEEIDRVIIYLMDDTKPICFWRGEATDFVNRNPEFKWLPLTNDLAVGTVQDYYKAGMLQIKLTINPLKTNPELNFLQYPNWNTPIPKRFSSYTLRCFIFQCRDLPSADEEGSSDVYLKIWNQKDKLVETEVIYDNLNPIFFEAKEIKLEVNDLQTAPPIVFHVWDRDDDLLNLDDDDYLGSTKIFLTDANVVVGSANTENDKKIFQNKPNMKFSNDSYELNQIPTPRWHDVKAGLKDNQPSCGQVLCSFVLIEDGIDFKFRQELNEVKLSEQVQTKDYNVDINVLGLRELQSFGILPIKKPFIQFNIRSLLPPERAEAVSNIKTAPKSSGNNPIINQTISFSSLLPTEQLFCPKLSCEVYDYICKGLSQPIIGSFVIDIGEVMQSQLKEREDQLQWAQKYIKIIRDKIEKTPEFTGEINEEDSLVNSQINYARSIGYDVGETISAFTQGNNKVSKFKKKKKRGKMLARQADEHSKLLASIQEVSDLEEGRTQNPTSDDFSQTFMGKEKDETIIIREDDYGDENSELLEPDQINSRQMKLEQSSLLIGQRTDEAAKSLNQMVKTCMHKTEDDKKKKQLIVLTKFFKQAVSQQPGSLKTFADAADQLIKKKTNSGKSLDKDEELKENKAMVLLKSQLLMQVMEAKKQNKEDAKKRNFIKMKQDGLKMSAAGILIHKNLLMPQYQMDERLKVYREVSVPSDSLYMAIGYDGAVTDHQPITGNRHYRKFYMDELENNKEIFQKSVFYNAPVMRGQSRGLSKGFFDFFFNAFTQDESGQLSSLKEVGSFKGFITIYNKEDHKQYKQEKKANNDQIYSLLDDLHLRKCGKKFLVDTLDIGSTDQKNKLRHALLMMDLYSDLMFDFLVKSNQDEILQQQISNPTQCIVRLYILEAFDLASRDIGSDSDPYIFIKCGGFTYNGQDKYQLDEPNPKFHQSFEMNCTFPGAPPLEIELWDYDDLFGDDLIGKTVIDMDERQFCQNWRQIQHKPIEYRELYHASSSMSQGSVICWLDIEESSKKKGASSIWDITPEPIKDYQLRVSVYDTKNVPREDVEGTSDVFVKTFFGGGGDVKETDTHWRCTTGTASFNYRLLYDFKAPSLKKNPDGNSLRLQLFDRDLFKSNDFLCEFTLDLDLLIKDCRVTQKPIHLSKKYYTSYFKDAYGAGKSKLKINIQFEDEDSFWLSVKKDANSKPIKIRLDVRVLPGQDAKYQNVGSARTEPNHSPVLKEPYGRFKFSLNPLDMLWQLMGPEFKLKCLAYLGTIICAVILFLCLPIIFSDIISKLFLKMFGLG